MDKLNINWNTDLYCLIGNPISKSLSPKIHNYIFKINDVNSIYLCFNLDEEHLNSTLNNFKALGIKGFNVTVPYKIEIMKYLDEIDDEAKYLGAVNTVKNIDGCLIGYNTDGSGFVKSLEDRNIYVKNKTILILGAGGASYAISTKLALEGAKKIIILNRTLSKGKELASSIHDRFNNIETKYDTLNNAHKYLNIDILINCTSIGMYPDINSVPLDISMFEDNIIVCDIVYKPVKTKLLRIAEARGIRTVEGIDMLINQGLLSQKIWFDYEVSDLFNNINKLKNFLFKQR